jgi:2-polyprenyl-6-methoxyphenol hydroxylase-like FAD-dependent oxidoreductase
MFAKKQAEVLVAGAGPVGMFTAAELTRKGIDVVVADEELQGAGMSYALALHPTTMELLDNLDLAHVVAESAYRVRRLAFYEKGGRVATMDFDRLPVLYPFLAMFPQSALERLLEDYLRRHKAKVRWQTRVAGFETGEDGVVATLEKWGEDSLGYGVAHTERVVEKTSRLGARFVVGADGHESSTRSSLNISSETVEEGSLFAVFEFVTDADLNGEASVVLNPDSTNVLWPLPGRRARWSFQLTDPDELPGERIKSRLSVLGRWQLPQLSEDRLAAFIEERAPWFTGRVEEVIWSVAIRFGQRLADRFGGGRVWLAGDAAHLAGPVGMHSMNVGFREGRDLAEKIRRVLHDDVPLHTLDAYDAERRAEWRRLLDLDRSLRATEKAPEFVRRNARRVLSCTPASGTPLEALLAQVGLEFAG